MADELARINLLTDLKATIEASTEDGTPGIATDFGHRLGWLSGGAFRWGALTGSHESFASVKCANIPAGSVPAAGADGKLEARTITDDGTTASFAGNLKITNLTGGAVLYKNESTGYVGDAPVSVTNPGTENETVTTEAHAVVAKSLQVLGVLFAEGSKVQKRQEACIYMAEEGSTAQSIPSGATPTKITPFTANLGGNVGAVPDHANDRIVAGRAGVYLCGFTRTYAVGTANVTWHVGIAVNGAVQQQTIQSVKTASTSTPYYAATNVPIICAEGDVVDVRMWHDNGAAVNITYEHATLYVSAID